MDQAKAMVFSDRRDSSPSPRNFTMVPAIPTNRHGYGHGQSYGTGLLHFHGYLHFILVHFSTGLCLWIEIAPMHNVSATETAIIYGDGATVSFLLGERWGTLGWIGAALELGN
ncbi:unnamed protein product [Prunus armeniaca]